MNRFLLVFSVLKKNRLFSAALILIYTLAMALMVMLCLFPASIDATFQTFLDDYGLPDAYLVTEGSPTELGQQLEATSGVESASGALVLDLQTELSSGKVLSLRYIGVENNGGIGLYNVRSGERVAVLADTVAVSSAFADYNGIVPGDSLSLPGGQRLTVTDIVSTPETISAARNSASWYDEQDFAFIYLPNAKLESLTGLSGTVNQFRIYFEDSADAEAVLAELEEIAGPAVISAELFENSAVDRQIRAGLDGAKALVAYLPGFICLISILFSTLFMRQIIHTSEKEIALLCTLGYSSWSVSGIFIRYTLLLTALSSLLGAGLGAVLLRAMLNIYRAVFSLPALRFAGSVWALGAVFFAVQLIGVVSCLLGTSGIAKADPAVIFQGSRSSENSGLPAWMNRSGRDAFSKITAAGMYRSRRRLALSVLCCVACLCLNHLVIGVLISKETGLKSLFQDRLNYDAMVYCEGETAVDSVCALSCVETAEKQIAFTVIYDGEAMRVETLSGEDTLTKITGRDHQPMTPEETGIFIEEGFARRHGIREGDTIAIDGVSIEVTGITREYLYPVMYISRAQAEAFGYTQSNCAAVSLRGNCTMAEFSRAVSEISGYQYFTDTASREKCAAQTLHRLDMPCLLFLAFAMIIGLLIIINMNVISIKERSREYATLQVLGTEKKRFWKMASAEGGIQFLFTGIIGTPSALLISQFIMTKISSVSQEYPLEQPGLVTLLACGLILLYVILGGLITLGFISHIDVLKILGQKE